MKVKYSKEEFEAKSIEHARYIFKKSFEENEDFRDSYRANIAMLLYDRYNIKGMKERNQAAKDIMDVIFDAKDIKPIVHNEKDKIDDRWEILDL